MQKGKVLSLEDRIPKIKEHRRRKANRRLIFLLSLFFLLIACVVYFQSPLSHIHSIKVDGNQSISEEEMLVASGLRIGDNIWKVNKKEATKKIKELPEIKSAEISYKFPNKLEIIVKEFKTIAYVEKENKFYPILENGIRLDKEINSNLHSPILIGFTENEVLDELAAQLQQIPSEIVNSISEIKYEPKETDKYRIILYMNDGFEVHATMMTFAEKMTYYPSIVSQLDPEIKGVIDFEVGSYFRKYEIEEEEVVEEEKAE